MPLDVIMPALGMAQETGQIVQWHKKPGDPVSQGDVLFEVETDKATMEVEAAGDGYLTDVTAEEGAEVPVGNVIARISETAQGSGTGPGSAAPEAGAEAEADPAPSEELPEGKEVIMPTLGMAQDSGLLVAWHKAAGDAVAADDILFEVETDKSTMEVEAGADGYIAALLAEEGDDVPTGQTIAIVSTDKPANPITRKLAAATQKPAETKASPEPPKAENPVSPEKPAPAKSPAKATPAPVAAGRILASPKLRRLARERGLKLERLVEAGYAQPFHVKDLEILEALPDPETRPAAASAGAVARRLTAEIGAERFTDFADWAAEHAGLGDVPALLAGMAAASLGKDIVIAVETFGETKIYAASTRLSETEPSDDAPELRIRDLRFTAITEIELGGEDVPGLTLTKAAGGLAITLEYSDGQLGASEAIALLSNFAGRMEQPLRHLL